jgi:hypothetical protein
MAAEQVHIFIQLKDAVQRHASDHLGISKALVDWSVQDIRDFQADLEVVCKSTVSEKWVYTHFKNQGDKLPRIDVLNLLSLWVGYKNWDEFLRVHDTGKPQERSTSRKGLVVVAILVVIAGLVWMIYPRKAGSVVVFKDAYTQARIDYSEIIMKINNKTLNTSFIPSSAAGDTLLADGPYYKQKKVPLPVDAEDTLVDEMLPDDYALMLNFFSRSTADDLERRGLQLMDAIHPEAKIFQSHPAYDGIELLNREEFIDRLILPINSLKNLEIQHIIYKDDKIYRLQFIQKIDENETH